MTPKTDRNKPRRIVRLLKPGETLTVTVTATRRIRLRVPGEAIVKIKKAVDNADAERQ